MQACIVARHPISGKNRKCLIFNDDEVSGRDNLTTARCLGNVRFLEPGNGLTARDTVVESSQGPTVPARRDGPGSIWESLSMAEDGRGRCFILQIPAHRVDSTSDRKGQQ